MPIATQAIKNGNLPWLKWLLTLGDAIIIADYGVQYGPFGRTGEARMTRKYAPFKVNTKYSGTADNNFISKALGNYSSEIQQVIVKALQ